ncbi:glycosyltransferase family 1 protein [Allobranchiibius sp. GilTou38]|uniref:glycosyltransferase family 4 protein n=1 Tax=Allobranchiibius sp. GilTou38 TaxID=2815210 RepID=UPI001AA133F6|nr:glycosyltransferase family 1 protein [Allobranchiibius sp. GilTou38]MBO1765222.1 glycosyltransferase family 4 protein [Allobranchiibius sp. GilTou38]
MTNARPVYDARWSGPHGIGRFAREVRSRLTGDWEDVPGADPVSMRGLMQLQQLATARARHRRLFVSPGFAAPVGWRGPVVPTLHDLMHLDVPGEAGRGVRNYYERVVRPAVRRAPLTLTMSQHAKSRIVAWSGVDGARVLVVGNGVDASYTPRGPVHQPGYPYVLYVGNHRPHKNLPVLLRAMTDPGLRDLHLVMTGDAVADTVRAAGDLGLGQRIHFTGLVPEAQLPAHYRGARVVAMPSRYEGFGLPLLEAMACGVPAVGGDATAVPEIAGDAALLVDPADNDAMAAALVTAAHDTAVRDRLALAGPRRAARFDWDVVGRTVDSALRSIEVD